MAVNLVFLNFALNILKKLLFFKKKKENQLVLHVNVLYDKRINVVCKECVLSAWEVL